MRSEEQAVDLRRSEAAGRPVGRRMAAGEWGLLVALSVLWGGAFFFTGVAVRELPPLTIVLLRVGLAALALAVVVRALGFAMPRDARSWGGLFAMGLMNNALPFSLVAWGQTHVASSMAAILNATAPFATLILAHAFTEAEKMTPLNVGGVAAGVVGVAVLVGSGAEGFGGDLGAQLAILLAAMSYAAAAVFGLRLRNGHGAPLVHATGQLIAAAVLLAPVAAVVDGPFELAAVSAETWAAIAGLAVLSTGLAYVLYFALLERAGASNLLMVTFLIPVSACVLGVAFLGETIGAREVCGFLIIAAGLLVIDGRIFSRAG